MEDVIDAGPVPYRDIELYLDPDLEHGLREAGLDPASTSYRLIDVPLDRIRDARSMPWPRLGNRLADEIRSGARLPPIVVMRMTTDSWGLLDGVNRTNAYRLLGIERVRAYELLTTPPGRA